MGKRIISQRRGRGSPTYRAPSHRYKADTKYLYVDGVMEGEIIDIVDDPGRNVPLAKIKLVDGREMYVPAAEGVCVGMKIKIGDHKDISVGNIVNVKNVPEGFAVFNLEINPYDGGKLVRGAGGYAVVLSHDATKTVVKLPSKKLKALHPDARVTIGVAAGGDIDVKPYVKAGNKYHAMKARNKLYPITSKKAMNAIDHKFGGSNLGVPKTSSRNAPPGRKVGSIAAKRTGVRKGKL